MTARYWQRRRGWSAPLLIFALTGTCSLAVPSAGSGAAAKAPRASTGSATQIGYSAARLGGTVNPHGLETTYYFQYGLSAEYGAQTAPATVGAGTVGTRVAQAISGLQAGAVYHYRIVAVSSAGTTVGQDRVFTTKNVALKFVLVRPPRLVAYGSPLDLEGVLTGTGGPGHSVALQGDPFPFAAGFADIGSPALTDASGHFAFKVTGLSENTQLRVATLDVLPSYSAVVTVRVAVRVILHAHRAKAAGYVRLYGTVTPAEAGSRVAFQWLRPGRRPATVGATVVKAGGVARFSKLLFIPHNKGGLYRALVAVTSGRHASGFSDAVRLHGAPVFVHRRHSHS